MNERSPGHVRELSPGNFMFGVRLGAKPRRYLKRGGYPSPTKARKACNAVLDLVKEGEGDEWFTQWIVDQIFERSRAGRQLPTQAELRRRRGLTDPTASSKLVRDYAQEWLDTKGDKEASTQTIYRHRIGFIERSELGALPLERVGRSDVRKFIDGCTTLGPRAKRQLLGNLKSIFKMAVEDGLIPRNPAVQVKTDKPSSKRPVVWTEEERNRFLAYVEGVGDPLYPMLRLMAYTGLRISEAPALRWCDLHMDADPPYMLVERQALLAPGGTFKVVENTKTWDVRRTEGAVLDPVTIAALEAHRRRQREQRMELGLGRAGPEGFVFAAWDHRRQAWLPPLTNAVRERFYRLSKAAGVPRITPHGLRHTRATLLIASGVPDRIVSDELGHKDTRFTASVYVHPPQAIRAAILARAEGWEN